MHNAGPQVESGAIVAAGAMVPPGKRIPAGQVRGVHARVWRGMAWRGVHARVACTRVACTLAWRALTWRAHARVACTCMACTCVACTRSRGVHSRGVHTLAWRALTWRAHARVACTHVACTRLRGVHSRGVHTLAWRALAWRALTWRARSRGVHTLAWRALAWHGVACARICTDAWAAAAPPKHGPARKRGACWTQQVWASNPAAQTSVQVPAHAWAHAERGESWRGHLLQVWAGNPARYLRDVESEEHGFVEASASNYAELADMHTCEWRRGPWGCGAAPPRVGRGMLRGGPGWREPSFLPT